MELCAFPKCTAFLFYNPISQSNFPDLKPGDKWSFASHDGNRPKKLIVVIARFKSDRCGCFKIRVFRTFKTVCDFI